MLRSIHATVALSFVALATACDPPPPKMVASKPDPDGVASNSAHEQKMAMEGKGKPAPSAPAEESAQPLTTPLNAEPATAAQPASSSATGTTGKNGKPGKPGAKDPKEPKGAAGAAGSGDASKAECKQLFDKYIDLTLTTDSRFEGLPPEAIQQMKQAAFAQAQSEKGDPCSTQKVTRAQYSCAISAPTPKAWERCMK